ncbi:7245_t:CDS:2 [Ambispora gerdemannii]|uniref:7245_t:CDS:1 n=1 Tax=Ambispora gerdemannii TaxID=144530 RepID=A0A9N8VK11_9GLOM|nr:7245_t:CDS:2 [Ambispora gerdemannii]
MSQGKKKFSPSVGMINNFFSRQIQKLQLPSFSYNNSNQQSDYQRQNRFVPPPLIKERSWSMLANETFGTPSLLNEKSWSVLSVNNDSEERRFLTNHPYSNNTDNLSRNYSNNVGYNNATYNREQSLPAPITRETTAFPEPEFEPSLASSANQFLEETFKFEGKFRDDSVGRPDDLLVDGRTLIAFYNHEKHDSIIDEDGELTPRSSKILKAQQQQQQSPPLPQPISQQMLVEQEQENVGIGWYTSVAVPVIAIAVVGYFVFFNCQ